MKLKINRKWIAAGVLVITAVGTAAALPVLADTTMGPFPHARTRLPKPRTYTTPDGDTFTVSNATTGHYVYVGNAPRFNAEDLELTISKMALTLRVQAWVKTEKPAEYELYLLRRWKLIRDKFQDESMKFIPLRSLESLEASTSDSALKSWLRVAGQYSKHSLEGSNIEIYTSKQNSNEYAETILTAMLRDYLRDTTLTIQDGIDRLSYLENLAADSRTDPEQMRAREKAAARSRDLFKKQLGHLFTADSAREGREGYLTFVYPIAATKLGPFDQPGEIRTQIGHPGSIDARDWSDKWGDEFGGMPFLLVNEAGVAFHAPITNKKAVDVWYLRRGYVSHGCHRMDSSDVLELRAILPGNFRDLIKNQYEARRKKQPIPVAVNLNILEWPDVTDWNKDGTVEAMDVAYYNIPTVFGALTKKQTLEGVTAPHMGDRAQASFWAAQFKPWNGRLSSGNHFDVGTGTFYGIPKYRVTSKGVLVKEGFHDKVSIHTFENRGNRIIQYRGSVMPEKLNSPTW